jgi:hypothetical protein
MQEAQGASGIGRLSFGYFSLCGKPHGCGECGKRRSSFPPKKSISSVGARTHIQTTVALATHLCVHPSTSFLRQAQDERPFLLISWFNNARYINRRAHHERFFNLSIVLIVTQCVPYKLFNHFLNKRPKPHQALIARCQQVIDCLLLQVGQVPDQHFFQAGGDFWVIAVCAA